MIRLAPCLGFSRTKAAVRKEWLGASWQRCKVHFMRNILAKVPHREKGRFAAHLKTIWLEPDKKSALRAATALIDDYEKRSPRSLLPERGPGGLAFAAGILDEEFSRRLRIAYVLFWAVLFALFLERIQFALRGMKIPPAFQLF